MRRESVNRGRLCYTNDNMISYSRIRGAQTLDLLMLRQSGEAIPYSVNDWILFFYLYCFLGWCFETCYVSIRKKEFVNRGFMRGPFLPIYGSGAVIMLFVTVPVRKYIVLTYLFGAIGASILEFATGAAMEALFRVRYWDYSDKPFNIKGHICLGTTLAWGGLTLLMVYVIHPPIGQMLLPLPEGIKQLINTILMIGTLPDFALAFKAALDIRELLTSMTALREEIASLQKRVDAMLEASEVKQDFEQLKMNLQIKRARQKDLTNHLDFFHRGLLRNHPSITSNKFNIALNDLKKAVREKRGQEKE